MVQISVELLKNKVLNIALLGKQMIPLLRTPKLNPFEDHHSVHYYRICSICSRL